ncbi:MAG: hypothetical protein A3I29_03435 [Candidatus Magasanikbacteria bacterium RIFCSPLOWO2_02_FULL_44_11]|uniref:Uncharacterized protein n=2 Tax=Candidatus Magasanikiibacteriota TaxID=1752731 RepID=A0A1F6NA95_9BACT|nr:MAG: hypothetical protein A3D53_00310 [Candidatus Magasanikbacteria bacterium RIFCSPHIGHO2_02_FULL_45_10]OGH80708.1 MAG: hypothetical protein A3I29_03435 [Candidatus Magasanikbacteria bacterium RIFCSPLOWO2_02_FULL_44_11]
MTKSIKTFVVLLFVVFVNFTPACGGEESTAQLANPHCGEVNLPDASSDASTELPSGPVLDIECGSLGGNVAVAADNVQVFSCKLTARNESIKITKLAVTMRGHFIAADTRAVRMYRAGDGSPFVSGIMNGTNEAVMNWAANENLLPEAIQPENPVTIVLKADIGFAGQVILGSDFHFEIVSTEDVVAREVNNGALVKVNILSAVGGTYRIVPFQVVVTGDAPASGSSYTQAVLSGTQLGRFKITNFGSSLVFVTKATLADKGSHSGSMSYRLYYSDQNSSNYVANTAAVASDSMDFGDLSVQVPIDGGSYRYFTVAVYSSAASSGDSWQVAVPVGAVSYMTEEADLGYDGNGTGSLQGRIYGLSCDGSVTLGTIFKN